MMRSWSPPILKTPLASLIARVTLPLPAPTSKVPEPLSMVTQEASDIPWQFLMREEPYDVPDPPVDGGGACYCGGACDCDWHFVRPLN